MPFAFHSDLVSMYWRANLMASYGQWGYSPGQIIGHFIYALNLKAMQLIGFNLQEIFFSPIGIKPGVPTTNTGDWLRFANLSNINSVLFFLKIPHLIFDLLVHLILAKKFTHHPRKKLILISWWLNPINIYAFYLFSRHDSITNFFILLAVLGLAQKQIIQAIISLFLAIKTRFTPWLLAPIFALSIIFSNKTKWRKNIRKIIISFVLILSFNQISSFLPKDQNYINQLMHKPLEIQQDPLIKNEKYNNFLPNKLANKISSIIGFNLNSFHSQRVLGKTILGFPIILILYSLSLIIFLKKLKKEENNLDLISRFCLASFCLFFLVNPLSPHYFAWLSVLLTLTIACNKKYFRAGLAVIIFWVFWAGTKFDITMFSFKLFLPVSMKIYYLPVLGNNLLNQISQIGLSLSLAYLSLLLIIPQTITKIKIFLQKKRKSLIKLTVILLINGACLLNIPAKKALALSIPTKEPIPNEEIEWHPLTKNQDIIQEFTSDVNEFGALELRLENYFLTHNNYVLFAIKEKGAEQWHYQAQYNALDFYNGWYYPFGFPIIKKAKNKKFIFKIECIGNTNDNNTDTNDNNTDTKANQSCDKILIGKVGQQIDFRLLPTKTYPEIGKQILGDFAKKIISQKYFFAGYGLLLTVVILKLIKSLKKEKK